MNRRQFVVGASTIWLSAALGMGRNGKGEGELDRKFGETMNAIRQKHSVPAMAAAFVKGDGTVICNAVGFCREGSEETVSADDAFHIGSCTKAMTATMVAKLVERGMLDWEITVAEAFPDLKDRLHPSFRKATLFHFLAHRAGLPDDSRPNAADLRRLRALTGRVQAQRQKLVGWVLARPPAYPLGERMVYANAGYVIAAAMAEAVTGRSWEELMNAEIFGPLGMKRVGFGAPTRVWGHNHLAHGCQPISPSPEADNPLVLAPAGGVHCSLNDWAKFAVVHLNGAQGKCDFLKPETFQRLHDDPFKQGYALGWLVVDRKWAQGIAFTHAGSNTLWFAVIWLAPKRNAAFLAAANCGGGHAFRACDDAIGAMIERFL